MMMMIRWKVLDVLSDHCWASFTQCLNHFISTILNTFRAGPVLLLLSGHLDLAVAVLLTWRLATVSATTGGRLGPLSRNV